ncbi:arfGAP with SH3 domain, ANK repeat and PH domain-containing protein-like isoform X2 [Macrosteles quadrilineatus]|uniref:arfGAP with SH3 domain, ANK repeat and PH domain-containing protein-like isoform X2 n=1 Tax=Macrosteles quadrilineatus TaxID=74068 RepID=UPI0023E12943|nr:arfGAP with SH3 domain, ANK repeat and PH domain-containing protein-like isoform X2 [Macrosteles quadrilineatus]XP_054266685.1 arfGAP with SH3 domain, ANK repeat and PH domain-containing protein-like isoform X2 [Macrosteles quadrilineatus]
MPGLIGVNEFIEETREDYNSPTTSTFVSRMGQCRQTITTLEETLDLDRECLIKMKKAVKAIHYSGNLHVDNEMYLARVLERLGGNALSKDQEPDIGAAFLKFAVVHKELSALMKTLMQNVNNIVMFPVDSLLKGDLRGVKGDLKRPFDRASKEFEAKYVKIEKERKQQAKEAGLIRTELSAAEIADDMEKERRLFQLQMSEYLLKVNEIKTKKSVELLQHLIEYFHAQTNYFQDGLKTIEHFGSYVADLSTRLQTVRQKQDEERRQLNELKQLLLRSAPGLDKETSGHMPDRGTGYSLHQLQGDKQAGMTRTGHLMKKSEGKMRRVWQKRRCAVQAEGFLEISHGDETKPPTKVNLLTCQIKMVPDDKRCFDVLSYNRTYHFQAEDETDQRAWMSVLINCRESALYRAFDDGGKATGSSSGANPSLLELQQAIIRHIQRLPSNDHCCDCNSQNDTTWLSINFGVVVCIECSGIHRDLGVHISRIQSLTLDHIGTSQLLLARHMTNHVFNDVMEANLDTDTKPNPSSSMDERYSFIRAKYLEKRFVKKTCSDEHELLSDLEHAVKNNHLRNLLQVFAEGADLSAPLPSSDSEETALHLAVIREIGLSLCIVDFLVQNMRSAGLDKITAASGRDGGGNTALHLCAIHDKPECMKLLLRSGADPTLRNAQDKTPLDIATEKGHHTCEELLRHVSDRQKSLFENINIDWNLSHDEGSTDFEGSDDETVIEDRNGCVTPERKQPSRPPSYTESPVNMRSRSSTCDSLKSSSYRQPMPPPPPPQNKKPPTTAASAASVGSLKKRVAPLPPANYGTLPSNHNHNRSPSDPNPAYHTLNHHKRSPSTDSSRLIHLAGAKLVIPPGEIPTLKSTNMEKPPGGIQRPRGPPPPAPTSLPSSRLSNGQSTESISSLMSDIESSVAHNNPVPPPRKKKPECSKLESYAEESEPYFYCPLEQTLQQPSTVTRPPRCKALYDCSADNEDELSFKEGDIILVTSSSTEDENWMEGALERDPSVKGMFPISFVYMLNDS